MGRRQHRAVSRRSFASGLLLATQLRGQASGNLSGVVVNQLTAAPIRRAVVTLEGRTRQQPRQTALALTDGEGRFSFTDIPAGEYRLFAVKDGYAGLWLGAVRPIAPGKAVPLAAGENRGDLNFRLPPLGALAGHVLDDEGDPLVNAQVELLQPVFERGKRQTRSVRQMSTNDRGEYRFHSLPPGRYYLRAVNLPQRFRRRPRAPEANGVPLSFQEIYLPSFYPGTEDLAKAALFRVAAGQELQNLDFRVAARLSAVIRGQVLGVPPELPKAFVQIELLARDGNNNLQQRLGFGVLPPEFRFEQPGIAPGAYLLVATIDTPQGRLRGIQQIETASGVPTDVTVSLQPGVPLSGVVRVEGPGAEQYRKFQVQLFPGDGLPAPGPVQVQTKDDLTFSFTQVPPGVWDIGVTPIPPGGYLQAITLDKQDVLTEDMVVSAGSRGPLTIVLGTAGARLEGEVKGGDAAIVLLAPAPRFRHVTSFYQTSVADARGHYEFRSLRPGPYQLFAFADMEPNAFMDPEFLKQYEGAAVNVTLAAGAQTKQELTLIPARAGEMP